MEAKMDNNKSAEMLVESIARREFGSSWNTAISDIDTRGLHADTNRIVTVRVTTHTSLELLVEQAEALGFTVKDKVIKEGSVVTGQQYKDWTITRQWHFTLIDADKGDSNEAYPGRTPKGVNVQFVYFETRTAKASW